MVRITTEFLTLEVPDLFEKVLQAGPLTRAERMDRTPEEAVFAELNVYVGTAADEGLSGDADAVAAALLDRHRTREADATVTEERAEAGLRFAVFDLPAESWAPNSRRVVWLRGIDGGSETFVASFTLEYDRNAEDTYRPLADAMLASIEFAEGPFTAEHVARQAEAVWSIFDGMAPERMAAIRARHAEILGRRLPEAPVEPEEPLTLELEDGAAELDLSALADAVRAGGGKVRVRVALFPEPIEIDLWDGADGVTEETLGLVGALAEVRGAADAGRHAWDHCQLHFDATDYGAPEGTSNEDHFDLHGPADAFAALGAGSIFVSDEDPPTGALFGITFYPPWEDEHGCQLVLKDGRFVGALSAGDDPRDLDA